MKRVTHVLFLSFLVLALVACGSNASSTSEGEVGTDDDTQEESTEAVDVVKIGALHPLSGAQAPEGQEMNKAVQMAIDEVNEAGGIESLGGAQVELISGDHENNPEKGVSEVQRMTSEGVAGIVGPYTSGVALVATQEAEKQQVPFIIDIGSADEITERGFQFTFRTQPPATFFGEHFLTYFNELNEELDEKLTTAVLAYEDSVFGTSISGVIKNGAEDIGLEILGEFPHPASTPDLSSDVNKIKSLNPDVVISTTYLNDGTLLVQGMKEAGFEPKAIIGAASGAYSNAQFIAEETVLNQYIMDVNYTINPKSDLANEVKEKFREKYNQNFGPNAAYSYEATKVLLRAIERAGTTDREAVREEITKTDYTDHVLPQGPMVFDETGQNINAQPVLNQIVDGESIVVYPEEYKVADPVFPMP